MSIGSLIISYIRQPGNAEFLERASSNPIPFYWGGAMLGRFVGSWLLRQLSPGKVLAAAATGAIALIAVSTHTTGLVSGWTYLAIGLMISIMFPTIFSLASEGLGERAAEGSGVIATAIVGGAVVPLLTGRLADALGLDAALALPAACYLIIAAFGLYARRPSRDIASSLEYAGARQSEAKR